MIAASTSGSYSAAAERQDLRKDSCHENLHAGQGRHQMDVGQVCLLGLSLHFRRSVGEVHDSLLVARGTADTIQELLGTAQLQRHVSRGVTVVRKQPA